MRLIRGNDGQSAGKSRPIGSFCGRYNLETFFSTVEIAFG